VRSLVQDGRVNWVEGFHEPEPAKTSSAIAMKTHA